MPEQRIDAIRTVPLKLPETAAAKRAGAAPQLTYRDGPLLAAVEVFVVFWGSAWQRTAGDLTIAVNNFFDFILTSELLDQLAEYSTSSTSIGHGSHSGSTVVEQPEPRKSGQRQRHPHAAARPDKDQPGLSATRPQHAVLRLPAARRHGRAGWHPFVPRLLRLSRRDRYHDFLRRRTVSRLLGMQRRACDRRRDHSYDLARIVRGDHGSDSGARLV